MAVANAASGNGRVRFPRRTAAIPPRYVTKTAQSWRLRLGNGVFSTYRKTDTHADGVGLVVKWVVQNRSQILLLSGGITFVVLLLADLALDWVLPYPASLLWLITAGLLGAGLALQYLEAEQHGADNPPGDKTS